MHFSTVNQWKENWSCNRKMFLDIDSLYVTSHVVCPRTSVGLSKSGKRTRSVTILQSNEKYFRWLSYKCSHCEVYVSTDDLCNGRCFRRFEPERPKLGGELVIPNTSRYDVMSWCWPGCFLDRSWAQPEFFSWDCSKCHSHRKYHGMNEKDAEQFMN